MNAEVQKELERIEKIRGNLPVPDAKWLISQLKAAQDEIAALKSGDGLTTAWMLGFHQRDDEVRQLKAEVERLKHAILTASEALSGLDGASPNESFLIDFAAETLNQTRPPKL